MVGGGLAIADYGEEFVATLYNGKTREFLSRALEEKEKLQRGELPER